MAVNRLELGHRRGSADADPLRSWMMRNRLTLCASALIVLLSLVFYATRGFGLFDVHPKARLEDYGWGELKMIAMRIAEAPTDEAGIQIAKEFNLCDESGRIRADNCKTLVFGDDSGEHEVRIIGFRHDTLSDGSGRAGITFCFAEPTDVGIMSAGEGNADTNVGGWERSTARQIISQYSTDLAERGEKIYKDLHMHTSPVLKDTATVVGEVAGGVPEVARVTTADRYFLLSRSEVFGGNAEDLEGSSQYQLFAECANDGEVVGLLTSDDSTSWLRTSVIENDHEFYVCNREEILATQPSTTRADYVVAFCF